MPFTTAHGPVVLKPGSYDVFLSSNGNVAPELFKCVAPLKVGGKLVGMVALGRREGDALFDDEDLGALELLCNYVAVAMQNHVLSQDPGAACFGEPAFTGVSPRFL
jgi:hypothetical protein